MGLGRIWRKKPLRRPKKTGSARRRRQLVHRKRLVAMGEDAKAVGKMNPKEVRTALNAKRKSTARAAAKAAKPIVKPAVKAAKPAAK